MKRSVAVVSLGLMFLSAQPAWAQDPLNFFKNYFVTGDYEIYGSSLFGRGRDGFATANITISGFPEDTVDLEAAFLYVQTSEEAQWSGIDHAKFNGFDLGPGDNSFAKALNWDAATPTCWISSSNLRRKVTYRADVLRFIPVKENGKHAVNGSHAVSVPDSGKFTLLHNDGNKSDDETGPWAVGTSLLLVYRDPLKALRAIVIYDGGVRKDSKETLTQEIKYYYDVARANPAPKMTHVVGVGTLLSETVSVDGVQIATNPFKSASGPLWDNWTTTNFSLPAHDDAMTVRVAPGHPKHNDCLSYSAMVLSVNGDDPDNDGNLTRWEISPPPLGPNGLPLPDLGAMGARPDEADVFVELAYLYAAGPTMYNGVLKPPHTHRPKLEAINAWGDAFKHAPVANPNGTTGIKLHVDIGADYHDAAGNPLSEYIIPRDLARGGKNISETRACWDEKGTEDPADDDLVECPIGPDGHHVLPEGYQYKFSPGTWGWKTGLWFMKNVILGFDENRKDIFRYIASVHALGIPEEDCLNPDGTSNIACQNGCVDASGTDDPVCRANFPNFAGFNVPRTYSGIFDFPGGDGMLSLGGFEDEDGLPVGTIHQQAGTLLHESGHGFEFTHGGPQVLNPLVPRRENCIPWYHSAMNYVYQFGLVDNGGNVVHDFSGESIAAHNEDFLSDGALLPLGLGTLRYRSSWFAPKATSYLNVLGRAAKKHCNGSELLPTDVEMVRIDGASVFGAIDWLADGDTIDSAFAQDINFSGALTDLGDSASDWAGGRYNQVGSRRNVGGYYLDLQGRNAVGPMSLDVGRGDIGRGDIGRGDIGRGDIGRGDIGRGDIGRGAFGGGDTDVGAADEPFVELDLETYRAVYGDAAGGPPSELRACLTVATEGGFICATEGGGDRPVRLDWTPASGGAAAYHIYRFDYDPEAVFPPATLPTEAIATVFAPEFGVTPTTYLDTTAPGSANLAYFVIAEFFDETSSGISNFAPIATPEGAELQGGVTDPSGDSVGPDLVSATLTAVGGNLTVSVRFASGTFNPETTLVNLAFDTDENPSTGSPGVDSGCTNDATSVGSDFIANTSSNFYGTNVAVSQYVNTAPEGRSCNTYAAGTTAGTATFVADGVDFTIPLSALGNDDGRMRFKVLTATQLSPTTFTSVQDYMTDVGQPPGVVPEELIP